MNSSFKNQVVRFFVTALGALTLFAAGASPLLAQSRGTGAEATAATIDIQTASAAELETLPGVGPARAQAIIEYRTRTPFRRVEDLLRVSGIGRATFRDLRPLISVGGVRASGDDSAE